jgi:hypothetical protein
VNFFLNFINFPVYSGIKKESISISEVHDASFLENGVIIVISVINFGITLFIQLYMMNVKNDQLLYTKEFVMLAAFACFYDTM